jgi:hypothetical protein
VDEAVAKAIPPRDDLEREMVRATPRAYLERKIADKRLSLNPTGGLEQAKPVMAELETLSYVLGGTPGLQIDEIQLLQSNAVAYILVPDTGTFETVMQSLAGIGGSHVQWTGSFGSDIGGKKRYQLLGKWVAVKPAGGAGTGGTP